MGKKALNNIKEGNSNRCCRCKRIVDEVTEFRNVKSQKEWCVSHLCQQCQDHILREQDDTPTKHYAY